MLYCFVYDTLKFMELPRFVMLDKAVGQTPLQCMEAWRNEVGISADIPLTYAGRLDPMASGKLLILVGEECKKKDESVTQNLILTGYKLCKYCRNSKTLFPM